ncbi:MAG: hypothetical protein ABL958_00675 [Bdellovibrionia bacterium]
MGKFLKRFLIFSLPVLVCGATLEFKLSGIENSYRYKVQLLKQAAPEIETLVFGTSHAYYDFNPKEFKSPGFNLANTSQSTVVDAQLFEKHLEALPKLKTVVLNISYFSFEYRLYGELDDYREYFSIREFGIPGDGGWFSHLDLRRVSWLAAYGPTVTRRLARTGFTENLASEVNERGWFDSSKSQQYRMPVTAEAGRARANYHTSTLKAGYAERNLEAISRTVKRARERGVQVLLTQAPASKTYYEHLDPRALKRFDSYIETLRTGLGLPYHDFLRDSRFVLEDFHDNDHLNATGASKFSRIFDEEILQPLIK